ncbi:MAG TPA: ATP-binding protein, partial [Isosphaeraceae bacterium]|nr:ATP-binding protein [Isosphaeraceae bacterium]
ELVEDLLSFSGRTRVEMEPLSLNSLLQEMLPVLRRILDPRTLVNFQPGQELWPVHADPQQFNEALIHLCMNAQDAMPEGGRILIETENLVLAEDALLDNPQTQPGEHVRLRVRDTGRGIPAEIRPRIFEPFYTTKEPGKGAGLGLALVFGIVEQHHGWIDCLSETDQGTCFEIYLPRYWQKAPMVRLTPAPMETRVGPKTILLADDEAMIRDLGRTILQRHGYHVLLAEDGLQALEIYQRERQNIDLVILDLTMPRMSGDSAFRQMADIDPNVRVLFSSGYFAEDMAAGDERILGFLSKPYRHEELVNMVGAALERAEGISPAAGQE